VPDFCFVDASDNSWSGDDHIGQYGCSVNLLHEPSILPPYTSSNPLIENQTTHLNLPDDGKIIFAGSGNFSSTTFTSSMPIGTPPNQENLITIRSALFVGSTSLPSIQFTMTNASFGNTYSTLGYTTPYPTAPTLAINATNFTNYNSMPFRDILIENANAFYGRIAIDFTTYGGQISNSNVNINGGEFGIHDEPAISITGEPADQGASTKQLNISGNTILADPIIDELISTPSAINILNANEARNTTSPFDPIRITGNTITFNHQIHSYKLIGINLVSSSAQVTGNTIDGGSFFSQTANQPVGTLVDGIVNDASQLTNGNKSNTFFCSNIIANCLDAGMITSNWYGFAKLNDISTSGFGHIAQQNDRGVFFIQQLS